MCRLLGWVSRVPTSLESLLGAQLDEFAELSAHHGDGWGAALGTRAGVEVRKAATAARDDDRFGEVTRQRASLGLVHLRWATSGLPVSEANAHPFTDGRVAFAHNGSVEPPESLDPLVPADLAATLRGTTDSERFFLAVRAAMRHLPPEQALATTVERIAAATRCSSLNSVLLTPDALHVACRFDAAARPGGEAADYFALAYRIDHGGLVVASSGWGDGWRELPNGALLSVARRTLRMSVRPLRALAMGPLEALPFAA